MMTHNTLFPVAVGVLWGWLPSQVILPETSILSPGNGVIRRGRRHLIGLQFDADLTL